LAIVQFICFCVNIAVFGRNYLFLHNSIFFLRELITFSSLRSTLFRIFFTSGLFPSSSGDGLDLFGKHYCRCRVLILSPRLSLTARKCANAKYLLLGGTAIPVKIVNNVYMSTCRIDFETASNCFRSSNIKYWYGKSKQGQRVWQQTCCLVFAPFRANAIVIALFENFGIAQFLRIIPWSLRFFHCWSKRKTDVAKADTSSSL